MSGGTTNIQYNMAPPMNPMGAFGMGMGMGMGSMMAGMGGAMAFGMMSNAMMNPFRF